LVLPDRGSNQLSNALEGSTLTITPPMWLIFQLKSHKDTQNMKDIYTLYISRFYNQINFFITLINGGDSYYCRGDFDKCGGDIDGVDFAVG
jgi:hypothetical protein